MESDYGRRLEKENMAAVFLSYRNQTQGTNNRIRIWKRNERKIAIEMRYTHDIDNAMSMRRVDSFSRGMGSRFPLTLVSLYEVLCMWDR